MRAGTCIALTLAAFSAAWGAAPASAQENTSPEQMKKMYDDALQQLKASQERKNQLAAENEKLKQQIEAMNKDLAGAHGELHALRASDAAHAERTFFLRSHYMAWQAFAKANPETAMRWRVFLESTYLLTPEGGPVLIDRTWPTTPKTPVEPAATQPATTQATSPATQPTTQPTPIAPATAPAATTPATVPAATSPTATPATLPAATSQPATKPG